MNPTELFNLSGKVAIITGGGNGIGEACSRMLANYGAAVGDFRRYLVAVDDRGGCDE